MANYGKAFKTIRLIKDVTLTEAADALHVDERTLRDIESGKTSVITDRFDQLLQFYKITPEIVFELAGDQNSIQNIIHEVKRDSIFHQTPTSANELETLQRLIDNLEEQIRHLRENDLFQKKLIEDLTRSK
jgi:transcriptional regulator with XRE-family HTH domain